jgi:hypothetical protein
MRFDFVKEPKGRAFRRLTGVHRSTFEAMAALLFRQMQAEGSWRQAQRLYIEDQLLMMMLEYWREYRTYFHIAQARGISESAAYRNIKWCENIWSKSKAFRLPGRKTAVASERAFDIVLIDATGTPIERPKKTKAILLG